MVGAVAREMRPAPGRLGNTLRVVAVVLVLMTTFETFRIPEAGLACFIAVFMSQDNEAASVLTAAIVGIAGLAGLLLTVVLFMATLGEPVLRLAVIAAAAFAAMFASRAMVFGAPAFVAGFLVAYGLTYGDQVAAFGLQPGSVSNTAAFELPEAAFVPPEEALLYTLLWLMLVIGLSALTVAVANLLTGRNTARLLRAALAERLETVAGTCGGDPAALARLDALARAGVGGLERLAQTSGRIGRATPRARSDAALIGPVQELMLVVLVCSGSGASGEGWDATGRFAARIGSGILVGQAEIGPPLLVPAEREPLLRPLAGQLGAALLAVEDAFALRNQTIPTAERTGRRRVFRPDAWSNPDYPRFAVKVTLAAVFCYVAYAGADWPQIHTAMVTCFFVALGTEGETLHKAALRIGGCLIGAGLGIGTILWLMPAMTGVGDLLAAAAPVIFLAAWVSNGSARSSYAGVQIALAYLLVVLQGFGPTLDMQTGRDRVVGILFGIVVVSTLFAVLWPVRVGDAVRARLSMALEALAAAVAAVGSRADLRPFVEAIAAARGLAADAVFEAGRGGRSDWPGSQAGLADMQALAVPFAVVLRLAETELDKIPAQARATITAYHEALAAWLRQEVLRLRDGTRPAQMRPTAPVLEGDALASQAAWYGRLDRELGAALAAG